MRKQYSIAEARHNLAAIVYELERKRLVELTRRGEPVAVLLSFKEYERLTKKRSGFWEAYVAFTQKYPLNELGIEPEIFTSGRDKSAGREVDL